MRKPKLFWISAASPLASVIISTLLVYLIRSKTQAISYVRTILTRLTNVTVKTQTKRDSIFIADWTFTKGFESTFIKHVVLQWYSSCSCHQNRYHHWDSFSYGNLSKISSSFVNCSVKWLTLGPDFDFTGRDCCRENFCIYEELSS